MSALITLREISKSFGVRMLFRGISLSIDAKERCGLIGANGSGKSTLLRILAGLESYESGERVVSKGATVAYLAQEDEFEPGRTVEDIVTAPLRPLLQEGLSDVDMYTRVGVTLGKLGFEDRDQLVDDLSGGWRKRLALARALVTAPDLLLLDEPTNHLDLETILWLEDFLRAISCSFVVVSHDRAFLERVANRTIELDRLYVDGYLSVHGAYSALLEKREEYALMQAGHEKALATKVRREIEWLRRSPKARTTKAQYRKDNAGRLMQELADTKQRNLQAGKAKIDFTGTNRQTKRLMVAEKLGKELGGKRLFANLDIVLSPGVRIGLVGLNGSGKTTLLKTLAGELPPTEGSITRAPGLEVVMFDQAREQLDKETSLKKAISPYGDSVVYRDRSIHVVSWAKRFLFKPEQLDLPVGVLSGGEQARILIARLMLRPADVLLLDEPTNDLDIPTLDVLEESLCDFPGAVALISHDRYLLNRVSTVVLGLDGQGGAQVFADYDQWDEERKAQKQAEIKAAQAKAKAAAPKKEESKPKSKKLGYMEQREWDAMEENIQAAEELLETCSEALNDPAIMSDPGELQTRQKAYDEAQAEVDRLYARWEELEAKQQ